MIHLNTQELHYETFFDDPPYPNFAKDTTTQKPTIRSIEKNRKCCIKTLFILTYFYFILYDFIHFCF